MKVNPFLRDESNGKENLKVRRRPPPRVVLGSGFVAVVMLVGGCSSNDADNNADGSKSAQADDPRVTKWCADALAMAQSEKAAEAANAQADVSQAGLDAGTASVSTVESDLQAAIDASEAAINAITRFEGSSPPDAITAQVSVLQTGARNSAVASEHKRYTNAVERVNGYLRETCDVEYDVTRLYE